MTRTEHWKHQPRANGRFVSAERTTETRETRVTERVTVHHHDPTGAAATALPPQLRETPVFWQLLRDPAVAWQWAPGFAVDETARALATGPDHDAPVRERPRRPAPPARRPEAWRREPYPELAEDILASEYATIHHDLS